MTHQFDLELVENLIIMQEMIEERRQNQRNRPIGPFTRDNRVEVERTIRRMPLAEKEQMLVLVLAKIQKLEN